MIGRRSRLGWSIDPKYVSEKKKSHDRFFAELGKSLYLASMFEAKCRFVLQIVNLVSHAEDTGNDLLRAFKAVSSLPRQMLRQTINGLKTSFDLSPGKVQKLIDAIHARNYIAHDFGSVGPAIYLKERKLTEIRSTLREKLNVLIEGDSIVSSWVHEIQEREPAPVHHAEYKAWVMTWVFGDEPRLSRGEPSDVKTLCQYARIPYLC